MNNDAAEITTAEGWAAWWAERYEPYDGTRMVVCKRCRSVTVGVVEHDRWHVRNEGKVGLNES